MKNLKLIGLLILTGCGFRTIDAGNVGIEKRFGEIVGNPLQPGIQFYNPFTSSVDEFNIQEKTVTGKGACNTKDTQVVDVSYTATFAAEGGKVFEIYRQYGDDWITNAGIGPVIESQIKIAIGKFEAGDLVKNQDAAAHASFEQVKTALETKNVRLGTLAFRNIDFSNEFEKAVESKVVAEQSAMQAKNKTVQVEEEAKQVVLTAKAEAESMKIKSQALSQNKGLVQFEAVRKWDGVLPVNMYGNSPIPFINLESK